jgi:hypothetical protein
MINFSKAFSSPSPYWGSEIQKICCAIDLYCIVHSHLLIEGQGTTPPIESLYRSGLIKMSRRLQREPEVEVDWEDSYRKLRDKYNELQGQCNEKDKRILTLTTRIRVLESNFAQMGGNITISLAFVSI